MVAIYARQSVNKKDSLSIETQIKSCKSFAGKNYKIYSDKGFSGKNTKRPDFMRMFDDIRAGKIEKVVVYKLDRFSRSIVDFYDLWEILKDNNVTFVSCNEQFDTSTPMGKLVIHIIIAFAQMERENIAERVKDSYYHRHTTGAWLGGPAPYGFDIERTKAFGKAFSMLAENDMIENVIKIFQSFGNSDISLGALARELNDAGVKGPSRKEWDNVSVGRVLRSPAYVKADSDIYLYYLSKGVKILSEENEFDGEHACTIIGKRDRSQNKYNDLNDTQLCMSMHNGVIDSKTWLRVQERLENNTQINRGKAGKYSWLTGLIKCGYCEYSIKINNLKSENRLKLICSGKSNLKKCDHTFDNDIKHIEDEVAKAINEELMKNPPDSVSDNKKELLEEMVELDKKIARLMDALAEADGDFYDDIKKKYDEINKRRKEILAEINKEKQPAKPIDFAGLSFDEKRIVANEFINRVLICDDEINIEWKLQ